VLCWEELVFITVLTFVCSSEIYCLECHIGKILFCVAVVSVVCICEVYCVECCIRNSFFLCYGRNCCVRR